MTEILAAVALVSRSFAVLLSRKAEVESALAKLVKRADRKGIAHALTWTWGRAVTAEELVSNKDGNPPVPGAVLTASADYWRIPVTRIPLTIEGAAPRLAGWTFVATLQHLDGENIVRTVPGHEIPATYRTRGCVCDHCNMNRRRNDTYVLRHDDGRHVQVGSTCIRDFLGGDEAAEIAARAEILALAGSVASDDGDDFGEGSGQTERTWEMYLPYVAWLVRSQGWTPRWTKCPYGGSPTRNDNPTADQAWVLLTDKKAREKAECVLSEEDVALALASEQWAESITDDSIAKSSGDYLHNLRATARTGLVSSRTAGIVASAVTAYQREQGKVRLASERATRPSCNEYMGTVGSKVTFGLPAQVNKRTGAPLKNAPTVLTSDPLTLEFVTGYSTDYGYTTVLKFRATTGHQIVWKSSNPPVGRDDVGKRYTLAGTIKRHEEYKGAKQTLVSNCGVKEVPAPEVSSDAA
jgi:hypothetical protein